MRGDLRAYGGGSVALIVLDACDEKVNWGSNASIRRLGGKAIVIRYYLGAWIIKPLRT
jgi:hypothetical protein